MSNEGKWKRGRNDMEGENKMLGRKRREGQLTQTWNFDTIFVQKWREHIIHIIHRIEE